MFNEKMRDYLNSTEKLGSPNNQRGESLRFLRVL